MAAECGSPEHLIEDLRAMFQRSIRRWAISTEAGSPIHSNWRDSMTPPSQARAVLPGPGRNEPCPYSPVCKFKKCCLGKDDGTPVAVSP
jgi:hypothetical protein